MKTKVIYTLEDVILHLESLEMLDMSYTVEKFAEWIEPETGDVLKGIWIINYKQGEPVTEPSAIEFED